MARARAYYEEFAGGYTEAAAEAGWSLNGRLGASLSGVRPVHRAVDLACGTGETLRELARALPGAALVGVDLAGSMADRSAARVPSATVVRDDLRSFVAATPDGWFDVVTCIGGLEFVPHLPALLAGLGRVVAPGGRLVVTYEPLLPGWPAQADREGTDLGSNGLDLTTFRWEPAEVIAPFADWTVVEDVVLPAYRRDGVPTVYAWLHLVRPPGAADRVSSRGSSPG